MPDDSELRQQITDLKANVSNLKYLYGQLQSVIRRLVADGATSWEQIGDALGVSAEAARTRFEEDRPTGTV